MKTDMQTTFLSLRQGLCDLEGIQLQGGSSTSFILNQPVTIGQNSDGSPNVIFVRGNTPDEQNEAIVKTYITYGLIDRIKVDSATITVAMAAPDIQAVRDVPPATKTVATPSNQITFKEFTNQWFELYKSGLKETSKKDYRYIIGRYLFPAFGDRAISSITTSDIQKLYNEWKGLARSTINKMQLCQDQIFRYAVKDKLVQENPVDKDLLKNPSKIKNKREALNEEQYLDILENMDLLTANQDRYLLALIALTGMRRGEILGLQWEDVDFDEGLIHVGRNITYISNQPMLQTQKTESGYRSIPIDPRLVSLLKPIKKKGYIIGDGTNPITLSTFQNNRPPWRICPYFPAYLCLHASLVRDRPQDHPVHPEACGHRYNHEPLHAYRYGNGSQCREAPFTTNG